MLSPVLCRANQLREQRGDRRPRRGAPPQVSSGPDAGGHARGSPSAVWRSFERLIHTRSPGCAVSNAPRLPLSSASVAMSLVLVAASCRRQPRPCPSRSKGGRGFLRAYIDGQDGVSNTWTWLRPSGQRSADT